MKQLDHFVVLSYVIGILLIGVGFFFQMPFSAQTEVYEEVLMKRTILSYVGFSSGVLLLFVGYVFSKLLNGMEKEQAQLQKQILELETKVNELKKK